MKKYLPGLLLCLSVILVSCTLTEAMWNRGYKDRIKNFLISRDGQNIVFIGHEYHYVLSDHMHAMNDILTWSNHRILFINTDESDLEVDHDNNISGYVLVETVYSHLAEIDRAFLTSIGFSDNNRGALSLKIKITGKRYFAGQNINYNLPSLSQPYVIFIRVKPSKGAKIGMAALTPITATIDGVILLGKIVLLPFTSN